MRIVELKEFIIDGQRVFVETLPSDIPGLSEIPRLINFNNDDDRPIWRPCPMEVSDCNFNTVNDTVGKYMTHGIIEIGISRNPRSFTDALLSNKPDSIPYLGIDIDDKTYLDNKDKNIYTYRSDSLNRHWIKDYCNHIGLTQVSILLIDGWHSLNAVINDWKYTELLSDNGIVILHDTNYHPPTIFVEFIDRNMYDVVRYCTDVDDYGLTIAYKK